MGRPFKNKATPIRYQHGRSTGSISLASLQLLSVKWLFPGLVVAVVVSNQPWMLGPLKIGQYISLVNYLASMVIVLTTFRHKIWPWVFIVCIVLTRTFALIFLITGAEIASDIFLNIFFCITGAIIASRYINLVYKQVMIICLLSLLMMILQIIGIDVWTQFLIQNHSYVEPTSTLFVQREDLVYRIFQARPAGFFHSSAILSLITLFGLALHLSRSNGGFAWGTIVLSAMVVLAMAKSGFLGLILIVISLFIIGNNRQRLKALKTVMLTIFLFCLYSVLFPGLFAINLDPHVIRFSIFSRLNAIVDAFPVGSILRSSLEQCLQDTPRIEVPGMGSNATGLSKLSPYFFYIMASLPLLMLFFLRGVFKMRAWLPNLVSVSITTLLILAVCIATVSIWDAQIYWFIGGFGLLPLFIFFRQRYFGGLLIGSDRSVRPKFDLTKEGSLGG